MSNLIKFKNGSTIETLDSDSKSVRSKPHDFQYEDVSEYVRYMKQHPYKFVELVTGKKLHFWQRAYLGVVSALYSKGDIDVDDMVRIICNGK